MAKSKDKTRRKANIFKLIKAACKKFNKPIYLMRHLKTDANVIAHGIIGKTYKKIIGKKGGSLKHHMPYIPIREATINWEGRKSVKPLPKKYGIKTNKTNEYVVIVSPLMRTWISALLFIRSLTKNKKFTLTLIISPIIEKGGFMGGFMGGNKPYKSSYDRFYKGEVQDKETVKIKYCSNINKKKLTCKLREVNTSENVDQLYDLLTSSKHYRSYDKGGFKVDQTLAMLSRSCIDEFKKMSKILVYCHSHTIKNYLKQLKISEEMLDKVKEVNGYAIVHSIKPTFNMKLKLPTNKFDLDLLKK
jgi:hypothetical protein